MASVTAGTASVTQGQGTANVMFANPGQSTLSGNVTGVIMLPKQPTTPYTVEVTFQFTVNGSPGTRTTTTKFTVQ